MVVLPSCLAATSYLATATTATMTTTEAATTPSHRCGLKNSKGSKNDGGKFKLLAVQQGQGCYIAEVELGVYNLSITEMNQDTIQFQKRPGYRAATISIGVILRRIFRRTFRSTISPMPQFPLRKATNKIVHLLCNCRILARSITGWE